MEKTAVSCNNRTKPINTLELCRTLKQAARVTATELRTVNAKWLTILRVTLIYIICKYKAPASKKTHCVYIPRTSRLMTFNYNSKKHSPLEKITVTWLVKKLPIMFTITHHCTSPWPRWIQSTTCFFNTSSSFPTEILYECFISPMRAIRPIHSTGCLGKYRRNTRDI